MTGQELPEDGKSECHHHPDHPTQEGEFSFQSGDLLFEVGFDLHEVRPGSPPRRASIMTSAWASLATSERAARRRSESFSRKNNPRRQGPGVPTEEAIPGGVGKGTKTS